MEMIKHKTETIKKKNSEKEQDSEVSEDTKSEEKETKENKELTGTCKEKGSDIGNKIVIEHEISEGKLNIVAAASLASAATKVKHLTAFGGTGNDHGQREGGFATTEAAVAC